MSTFKLFLIILLPFLIIFQLISINSHAENTASGNFTVDGESTQIKHAYKNIYDGDITIYLVDTTLPKESIPDEVYSLGEKGKFKGIVFVISEKDKNLMTGGLYGLINAIHYYPKLNKLGTIGDGKLKIKSIKNDILSANIKTESENELDGHKYTYDISFSINLKKQKVEFSITGNEDPPSLAYGMWGKALFESNLEDYKKYSSNKVVKMLPSDSEELKSGIEFQQSFMPEMVYIESSNIDGDKAELKAIGKKGEKISTGSITMLKEKGIWKVNKQSWEP